MITELSMITPKPLEIENRFFDYIESADFPCLGAKSAIAKGQLEVFVATDLRSNEDDKTIHDVLVKTGNEYRGDRKPFRSVAIIFPETPTMGENSLEAALWKRLQALSDIDVAAGFPSDPKVSSRPEADDFAISFGGEGYFVVTLHPGASRASRNFQDTILVFNLHQQFEQLRDDNIFEKLSEKIVERDTLHCGSRNPMLGEHGKSSSARQYSGRAVDDDWQCPFSRKAKA